MIEKGGNVWASAMTGIAVGGFLVSLATQAFLLRGWYIGNYELLAALAAAIGVWSFADRQSPAHCVLGAMAALTAMLLGDAYRAMAFSHFEEWRAIPEIVVSQFNTDALPKLLRYGFGIYMGGYLGYYGRFERREEPE